MKPKKDFVAAWLSPGSAALVASLGIEKVLHLTTFFDKRGELRTMQPYPWAEPQFAVIRAVRNQYAGRSIHVVADLECKGSWSDLIHEHYLCQASGKPDFPHRPHVTLLRNCPRGSAEQFQHLVGLGLVFDRHGREDE